MSQREEKKYVPGAFGRVYTFNDSSEVYNVDFIDLKALSDFVKENATEGKFRIQIQKQRNDPTKLSISLNTYQPKAKEEEKEESLF